MAVCVSCQEDIPDGARFCPHCGTRQPESLICPQCGQINPTTARFCLDCGLSFQDPSPRPTSQDFSWSEQKLADHFFAQLEVQIAEEQDKRNWNAYVERFHASDFKSLFERRIGQLARQTVDISRQSVRAAEEIKQLVESELGNLADYFLIHTCADINRFVLPERILRYQNASLETVDLLSMIHDYLDWEQEEEPFYTDFLKMPVDLLRNASQSFLHAQKSERLLVLCDLSLLSNLKEGFAFTDRSFYWKAPMQKAHQQSYLELKNISKHADWITINNQFFHANPSLDIKMLKLLRKLQVLFQSTE
jgi:ribosomal protein L40E